MSGYATCKAVLSGDTVVLMGRAVNGPPPELQLSLAGVMAPKLARGPSSVDEAFAWESREFLRKLVLGKAVQFRSEVTKNSRQYGTVWVQNGSGGAENVSVAVARAGWCAASGEGEEIAAAAAEAREAGRGIHTSDAAAKQQAVRSVKWSVDAGFARERLVGSRKRALVEYVKDGSNYRCMLLPEMIMVSISLAGVRCGRVNRPAAAPESEAPAAEAAGEKKAEPFAEEAKFFVESRLLHREVEVGFASVDKFGNALCTVSHSAGKIAAELVRHGLGRVSEPGLAGVAPAEASQLREAEKQAKQAKVRLWRGYEAPKVPAGVSDREFEAVVVEAISGDQVAVQRWHDEEAKELRLALSSVRAPRMPNPRAGRAGEPWGVEAREALLKLAVGKRCRVKVEYAREIPNGDEKQTRVFASLTLAGGPKAANGAAPASRDVAELLVDAGLLAVVPPRTSEERAERFDELAAAEKRAKAAKAGTHGGKSPPPPAKVADLAGDAKRARAFLPYLKRQKSHKAFVETVFAGSRLKLRFAGENCAVVFSLAACRAPAPASAARPEAEAGGDASRHFARRVLLQRTVEASVEDMDRNGVALGSLGLLDKSGDDPSYETRLLRRGLARLDHRRAANAPNASSELANRFKAWADLEAQARKARLGLWADAANVADFETAASDERAKLAAENGEPREPRRWSARLADIADGARCSLHDVSKTPSPLDAVAAKLRDLAPGPPLDDDRAKKAFRRNATVAALFDGEWCRARVLEHGAAFKLRYLDYGNLESEVAPDRLRPLDPALAALPPAAVDCELAYVAVAPLDDEAGVEAARLLHNLAWDRPLTVFEHATAPDGRKRVVLHLADKPDDDPSLNELLVDAGLARVPSAAKRLAPHSTQGPALLDTLLQTEQRARSSRAGLWRYGDVDYSDDERL